MRRSLTRIGVLIAIGFSWALPTASLFAAVPGQVVDWGEAPTERQRQVLREYAEGFWAAWDAHEAGEPAQFAFVWPEDVQPGDGFDPFMLSVETLSAIYADRLVVDAGSYTYDLYDLIRDDPEVLEAFRHHTLTGELVTPLTQQQAALRHFLLQVMPQNDFSEINGDDEDPCTDGYYVEATSTLTVTGSTMSSEIDVMKKPKPCPPGGGTGPPGDYDEFERALRDLVRNSGLDTDAAPTLYSHDRYFFDPGFDCDDFATAMAHYLERHLPKDGGGFTVWSLWLTWWGGGHAVTVVVIDDKFYVIDPQSGAVRGPLGSRAQAVDAGWEILKDPLIYGIDPA